MAVTSMRQGAERHTVEQALGEQSAQEWQRTIQQIEQLAQNGALPQHYQITSRVVREQSKQQHDQVIAAVAAMPPSIKSAVFELTSGVVRLSEQYGQQTAEQVGSFLCQVLTTAAKEAQRQP
jgi:hypothetical protein